MGQQSYIVSTEIFDNFSEFAKEQNQNRRMWQAVINQAITDALSNSKKLTTGIEKPKP
jgi:hypothetical protein